MRILFVILIGLLMAACGNNYTPKPRGFFRIDFPKKEYQPYTGDCPFTFEYPAYSLIERDPTPGADPCWINITMKQFKATIHLSYKQVVKLTDLTEDSRTLVYKHTVKADGIDEVAISNPANHVYGTIYKIKGNTASSVQFFLTDSTKHFIRGALYFYTIPQADSLAPVITFVQKDIDKLVESFRWR